MVNFIKKIARQFGFSEIHIHDFTPQSHVVYYEYFYDESGNWAARFYDHDTGAVVKETKGRAVDKRAARKAAQSSIRQVMRTFKRAR